MEAEAKEASKMFYCSLCGFSCRYDYFGNMPPFCKALVLLEDAYVIRDPFSPNPGHLMIGGRCSVCAAEVCPKESCSLFYTKRFCLPCIEKNITEFPSEIQQQHMALEQYANDPPTWERGKRRGVAEADIGGDISPSVSALPQRVHAHFGPGQTLANQMDAAQKEAHTTAPSLPPVEESSYSLYDGLDQQPISPGPTDHWGASAFDVYNSPHRAGINKKSNSTGDFSAHEARTVGYGRPRSVSQPLPAKASSPLYFWPTEADIKDGCLGQYHAEVAESDVANRKRQNWDERANQTHFSARPALRGSISPESAKTVGANRLLLPREQRPVHNSGLRDPFKSKQRVRLQSAPPTGCFNSPSWLTTACKSEMTFEIRSRCTTSDISSDLNPSSEYFASAISSFDMPKTCVPAQNGYSSMRDYEELSGDMLEMSIARDSSREHMAPDHSHMLNHEIRKAVPPGVIGGEKKHREYGRKSPHLNASDEKPRNINSRRDETYSHFCDICMVPFATEDQFAEHRTSTKHRNKLSKYKHPTFCDYCKVNLNSESQALEHFKSGRHEQTVAKAQKAPVKIHPPLASVEASFSPIYNTLTTPDSYHIELYQKAMRTNSAVCFLPTGTGKNLVSALVITHTLFLNPTRQIIFLVDRVLLVLQQSDYLKKELGHLKVPVPQMCSTAVERPIRIGAVCGEMRKLAGQAPIFEHDVLVITADCYRNHLTNRTLRVEDVSLIVLDDAHHCNKDHPYNVIMRDYCFHDSGLLSTPKVLGLTTSTAGESSLDRTSKKMQRLLSNLGDAAMLTVSSRVQELAQRTSQTKIVCLPMDYTPTERDLLDALLEYATKCFNQVVRLSELKNCKEIFQPSAGNLLSKEDIFPILGVIDSILLHSPPDGDAYYSLLHFQVICEAICSLQECGAKVALEVLSCLCGAGSSHGLDWAQMKGLPLNRIRFFLERYHHRGYQNFDGQDEVGSGVQKLLLQLRERAWGGSLVPRPLAVILVKRPRTACCLARCLSGRRELVQRSVRVACGVDPTDAMLNKRHKECHVVVTTSVTGDGFDLSECQMVFKMDPSCCVNALSQIRSRAWGKETRMVAVCRDEEHFRRIQELLRREEHMRKATYDIAFS